MKISIVTPFFNSSLYLDQLADSIKDQTHQDWEWILVDDGSSFEEWQKVVLLAKSDARISAVLRHEGKPKGACSCRNTALDQCSGDYVLFLDSDDYLEATCLERRLNSVSQATLNPKEVLYFQTIAFKEGDPKMVLWDDPRHPADWLESNWTLKPPCQSSGPFWPVQLVKKIGGWNEDMAVWQDLEIHTRATFEGVQFIDAKPSQPDVYYRILSNSLSHQNFHAPEKTKSRLAFLRYCLRSEVSFSFGQKRALTVLAFSVLKALVSQKDWESSKQIADLCGVRIGSDIKKRFKQFIRFHQFKLNRLPSANKFQHQSIASLGEVSKRQILTRPFLNSWPSVSIIILTYNAAPWFIESLPHFLGQVYQGEWEILVIDSGSTDETLQLLEPQDRVRVHSIPNEAFGHGRTRNLAASMAHGDLLLYTVQDACPRNELWMQSMVQSLIANELDAVCGGQAVPHDWDKNPAQWYRPVTESNVVEIIVGTEFKKWAPTQQLNACGWDNVNAMYRKTALATSAFEEVRFGEDMVWAKAHLSSGKNIGYAKAHKVWHYHHQHPGFTRSRVINQLHWRFKTFDVVPPLSPGPNLRFLVKIIKAIVWHARILHPMKVAYWIRYNWQLRLESHRAGQEFGAAHLNGPLELDNLYQSLGSASPMATKTPPQ